MEGKKNVKTLSQKYLRNDVNPLLDSSIMLKQQKLKTNMNNTFDANPHVSSSSKN